MFKATHPKQAKETNDLSMGLGSGLPACPLDGVRSVMHVEELSMAEHALSEAAMDQSITETAKKGLINAVESRRSRSSFILLNQHQPTNGNFTKLRHSQK
jgi:hypothetical protein